MFSCHFKGLEPMGTLIVPYTSKIHFHAKNQDIHCDKEKAAKSQTIWMILEILINLTANFKIASTSSVFTPLAPNSKYVFLICIIKVLSVLQISSLSLTNAWSELLMSLTHFCFLISQQRSSFLLSESLWLLYDLSSLPNNYFEMYKYSIDSFVNLS